MRGFAFTRRLGFGLLLWLAACTGSIDGGAGAGGSAGQAGGGGHTQIPPGSNPGGVALDCDPNLELAETPLLKLSTLQYRNTVRDLVAGAGMQALMPVLDPLLSAVPDDSLGDSFRGLDDRIALEHVRAQFDVAAAVGDAVRDDAAVREALAGSCASSTTLDAACVDAFLDGFALRAYRRPLSVEEQSEFAALNDGNRAPADALRAMVIVVLMSPHFVNHVEVDGSEIGGDSALLQLNSFELASRLSYLFWQSMPDAELLNAAADGSLATTDGFSTQLQRVFDAPRTRHTLWQFWYEWLRLERFTGFETTRPGWLALTEGLAIAEPGHDVYADMVEEVRTLTELFTFEQPDALSALAETTANVTQSAALAELYGTEPYAGSGAHPSLPAGTRAGLFQRAALLVSNLETTNPFHRGALTRRSLLCEALPQPDPTSLPPGSLDPPPVTAAQTTRERYWNKVKDNGLCLGCHQSFSDLGFVLESFDALGRFRETERVFDEQTGEELAELPIDTTGRVQISAADEAPVRNAQELNQRMVASGKLELCLAERYLSFAARRDVARGTLDACALQDIASLLEDPAQGLPAAFARVARHETFSRRRVGEP